MPYEADVCPGWLCEQRAVIEGAQATGALKANALAEIFPDAPNPIIEAAQEGSRALNLYENEQVQRMKQKH